jgi:hypothetical protein
VAKYRMAHSRDNLSKEQIDFENLPTDKLRAVIERAMQTSDQQANAINISQNADTFIALAKNEGYVDNDYNGNRMNFMLQERGIANPTVDDFYGAFRSLKDSKLLQINTKAITAEMAVEADRRAADYKRAHEEPDYDAMTTEEIAAYFGKHNIRGLNF